MKIAVASEGKDIKSEVSEKGGRAPYYLVFENENIIETIKNPFAAGSGGAGFSVAHMLSEKNVNIVFAGKIGGNMESALKNKGIDFKKFAGRVEEIKELK